MQTKNILITEGAGFTGSHVGQLFVNKYPDYRIFNLDKLTYAGNLNNLRDVEDKPNYTFIKGDICDATLLKKIFPEEQIDGVIHLAAESHVDRNITNPLLFAHTNVTETLSLLQAAREAWNGDFGGKLFYHVSTDEVYGVPKFDNTLFTEETRYDPHSLYSASKAAGDHFVRAYHNTYGMPIVISNCSNNYGYYQSPEKLIPLFIHNIRNNKPLPVYGKGETYNIGGFNEWKNIDLIRELFATVDRLPGRTPGTSEKLIIYVTDRAGHDLRYAIDAEKIKNELGREPSLQFEEGIEKTVQWYLEIEDWLNNATGGESQMYYEEMYADR